MAEQMQTVAVAYDMFTIGWSNLYTLTLIMNSRVHKDVNKSWPCIASFVQLTVQDEMAFYGRQKGNNLQLQLTLFIIAGYYQCFGLQSVTAHTNMLS